VHIYGGAQGTQSKKVRIRTPPPYCISAWLPHESVTRACEHWPGEQERAAYQRAQSLIRLLMYISRSEGHCVGCGQGRVIYLYTHGSQHFQENANIAYCGEIVQGDRLGG
jgi:hypothetical protein